MNSNEMRKENIAVTQKILFLSYRLELYEEFCFCLAGQHDILHHRIRENEKGRLTIDKNAVLCIIEMLRFTEKSSRMIQDVRGKYSGPILFLSGAQGEKTKKEEALCAIASGADRYLAGIQSIEEVIAEVKALIRLQERILKRQEVWEYQELKLIPDRRQVFVNEKEILLTRKEFDIVFYLAAQGGRAVSYKELYEAVWHERYLFDDASIMAHIHRIRLKLEKGQEKPFYIQNVYGIGYRFGCSYEREPLLKKVI